jgi:hypothetical protein
VSGWNIPTASAHSPDPAQDNQALDHQGRSAPGSAFSFDPTAPLPQSSDRNSFPGGGVTPARLPLSQSVPVRDENPRIGTVLAFDPSPTPDICPCSCVQDKTSGLSAAVAISTMSKPS